MSAFTQSQPRPTTQSKPEFMNFRHVPSEDGKIHFECEGATLIIDEEYMENCYQEYNDKASLRRVATGGKAESGNARPITNFTTSSGLEGALWGNFNINIPVDVIPS